MRTRPNFLVSLLRGVHVIQQKQSTTILRHERSLGTITVTSSGSNKDNNSENNKRQTGKKMRQTIVQEPVRVPVFQEPIHILGAGSIGLLLAASIRFSFPSYPVKLLLRDKPEYSSAAATRAMSVCLRQTFLVEPQPQQYKYNYVDQPRRRPRIVHVPCETIQLTQQKRQQSRPIRNLFLTTKAFSAVAAVRSIVDRLSSSTSSDETTATPSRLVVFCNGALAVAEELTELLREHNNKQEQSSSLPNIYLAITTHGVYREPPDNSIIQDDDGIQQHVVHAGFGSIVMQVSKEMEGIPTLLDMAGLNCRGLNDENDSELQRLLWYKLAANCVINPLTALHQCLNGELRATVSNFDSYYYPSILREVAQVYYHYSAEKNATTNNKTPLNVDQLETELRTYVDKVLRDTAENRSSMLQDVLADDDENNATKRKAVRTEIDYLSGYVVRTGTKYGVDCPVSRELWERVCALHTTST